MKYRPGFQLKLISMMIAVFISMTTGIVLITYNVLKVSIMERYYSSGNSITESASRTIEVERYLEFTKNYEENNVYYDELRKYLFKLKTSNMLENLYTAEVNSNGDIICHVDGNERYGSHFMLIGKSVKEIRGIDTEELRIAFRDGKPTKTSVYRTLKGEKLISIYFPVFDSLNKAVAVVCADYDYNMIMNQAYKDLTKIIITFGGFGIFMVMMIFLFVKFSLIRSINVIKFHLGKMSSGDLSERLPDKILKRGDEIGVISLGLDEMQTSLKDIVSSILDETETITLDASSTLKEIEQLNDGLAVISNTTQQISAGMEETASSAEELDATANNIVENIEQVAVKSEKGSSAATEISVRAASLKKNALQSQNSVMALADEAHEKLRGAIEQSKQVNKINTLADSILSITEQTNLLAINAAIEAARAGKMGLGFSVVADEILQLASESGETANQILAVTETILESVKILSGSSQEVLEFIERNVVKDYEMMVETASKYSDDANNIKNLTDDFKRTSTELLEAVHNTIIGISEIAGAAQGVSEDTTNISLKTELASKEAGSVMQLSGNVMQSLKKLQDSVQKFKV